MLLNDVRYALRGIRRAPLYAATVAATIGLGLGLLTSAFTFVNAYVLRPIDLPDAYAPLNGPPRRIDVLVPDTGTTRSVGFMVVSPQYFPAFDVLLIAGRNFTAIEADEDAPVALVSAATARALWPGLDPIGRTLDLPPADASVRARRPRHASVRIIGVAEDVSTGTLLDGQDLTCVYFTTGLGAPGEMSLLVRGRTDNTDSLKASVAAAVNAVELDAPFRFFALRQMMGGIAWVFGAISAAASLLGAVGLLLAFPARSRWCRSSSRSAPPSSASGWRWGPPSRGSSRECLAKRCGRQRSAWRVVWPSPRVSFARSMP